MPEPESSPAVEPVPSGGSGRSPDAAESPRAKRVELDAPTIRTRGSGSNPSPSPAPPMGAASATAMPQPGQRVDTFEIQEAIGAGGMGAVYRAFDTRLHRLVALKILPPEQAGDAEVLQRFYQEAQAAAQLDHENIARVYTIGGDQNIHYIAFEYIDGTTIRQRVERNGPLPVVEAINYTLQIAGALVHAAERGVVHRDIKPSNIVVTAQGRAKLVDMGLARRFERGGDHGLTQSGMTLGTFDYISPEQARDPRDVDVRSDLYSLGCTLFHMLTGRPPFPEGTVLQKLLQHQEDPAPEVRSLNPHVPSDLAAILLKLMAKDRDRRYQTPEQLVRDLLTLAGALGLRSISPEGLVWMAATPRAAWERHLVWGLPAAALVLVVGFLIWWGNVGDAALPLANEPLAAIAPTLPPPAQAPAKAPDRPADDKAAVQPVRSTPAEAAESEGAAVPRTFSVASGDDLASIVHTAPAGSTIVLTDNSLYTFRLDGSDQVAPLRFDQRDLTVRAALGVRPILRLNRASDQGRNTAGAALIQTRGGRVVFEGLEFLVQPENQDEPLAALIAENTDLTLRRCVFHGTSVPGSRVSAVHVRSAPRPSRERSEPVLIDACHFGGGQVGVRGDGPVEVTLRDCTFGPADPAFWLENARQSTTPASLHLSHVSLFASTGPVFRFEAGEFHVRVDDSVVAPPREGEATLVAAQNPDGLDWVGRDNFYGKVSTFFQPLRDALGRASIQRFEAWSDGSSAPREIESIASNAFVWAESDPAQVLAQDDPTRAFLLGPSPRPTLNVGARRGPFGPISPASEMLASAALPATPDTERPETEAPKKRTEGTRPAPAETTQSTAVEPAPMPMANPPLARINEEDQLPVMPPMGVPEADVAPPARAGSGATSSPSATSPTTTDANPAPPTSERSASTPPAASSSSKPEPDASLVRTAAQFRDAVTRLGTRGGSIRLAADADLELSSTEIRGSGRWSIEGEPGDSRPRIRFVPASGEPRRGTGAVVLFRVRSGDLQLRGIDIVLERDHVPSTGRWAAFGVSAGTELSLNQCTVTLEGDQPRSAVMIVQAGDTDLESSALTTNPSAASIRVTDSLLRSGGDVIDVLAGRRLDLELTNAVVAAAGSLMHGHGVPRGQTAEPVKLVLRQLTARVAGGLVQLETAPSEPELPAAEVVARDSIFATTPDGDPLLRVDGQDAVDGLRDRVRWEGHGVVYHQIEIYRRDQTSQIGTLPVRYDRHSWEVAVAPRDDSPSHDDAGFVTDWDATRPLWTLKPDDVRLAPDSPARTAGPDLSRIPSPPRGSAKS